MSEQIKPYEITHETARGKFVIKINGKIEEKRKEYNGIRVFFKIETKNTNNPNWLVSIGDVEGRICDMGDIDKLKVKLEQRIKSILDMDEPGDFSIGPESLNLCP